MNIKIAMMLKTKELKTALSYDASAAAFIRNPL